MLKIKKIIEEHRRKREAKKYKIQLELGFKEQPTEDEVFEIISQIRKVNSNVWIFEYSTKNCRKDIEGR